MIQKRSKRSLHLLLYGLLIGLFAQACDSRDYVAQQAFDDSCWTLQDTLDFVLEAPMRQNLGIYLELQEEYIYQNMYLKLVYRDMDGTSKEILINQPIIDQAGNWLVEKQGGTYPIVVSQKLSFEGAASGTLSCALYHYMREDKLCGVEKVAVYFRKDGAAP